MTRQSRQADLNLAREIHHGSDSKAIQRETGYTDAVAP